MTTARHREGWPSNHQRGWRLRPQASRLCQLQRHFVVTTHGQHADQTSPNLWADLELTTLAQAWVAEITYIRLPTTFVYLACVRDASSHRCIGWQLAHAIDTRLTLAALEPALAYHRPASGLLHHSDRGGQYASQAYVARLQQVAARISLAAVGTPYDNAKAESLFKTLKPEEVSLKDDHTVAEAETNIRQVIADV